MGKGLTATPDINSAGRRIDSLRSTQKRRGGDPTVRQPEDKPLLGYADAAAQVIAAFAAPGAAHRDFVLPELAGDRPIRGAAAIGFHLVDYVVHGWDVARTLSLPFELPAEVLARRLPSACGALPDDARRLTTGAAFAPALTIPADADPLKKIIFLLGRSPAWTAPKMSEGPANVSDMNLENDKPPPRSADVEDQDRH